MCLSLDSHPNIEVRLFNPSRARTDRFKRGFEMMLRPFRATRRMHNKQWIADGRLVIAGGRNIGDAYFDADEQSNFRDLDVWLLGPVADDAAMVFDCYWNSPVVVPIGSLRTPRAHYLPAFRAKLERIAATSGGRHYLTHVDKVMQEGGLLPANTTLHWTRDARLISDPPEKAFLQKHNNWIMRELMPVLTSAQQDVQVDFPLFHPGCAGQCRNRQAGKAAGRGEGPDEFARRHRCRGGSRCLCQLSQGAAAERRDAVRIEGDPRIRRSATHVAVRIARRQPPYQGLHCRWQDRPSSAR